ncbi:uncharacterized protein LOC119350827 [Triticum dicoccoides]|uniref:uncharacterized protein LOC119350827 n=1 Tax=Triticum dicoccoides TaxID=85692 RepID=UPI00188EA838|nr:uncharacterized protein LOC119350827 [Triticum dicoccoides]
MRRGGSVAALSIGCSPSTRRPPQRRLSCKWWPNGDFSKRWPSRQPETSLCFLVQTKCAAEPSKEHLVRSRLAQIQTKKEELFGLISELDPAHCTRVNSHLAIDLSAQVQPKPSDPKWPWYRRMKRMNNYTSSMAALRTSAQ